MSANTIGASQSQGYIRGSTGPWKSGPPEARGKTPS